MAGESEGPPVTFGQRLRWKSGLVAGRVDPGEPDAVEHAGHVVRSYCTGGDSGAAFDTYGRNDPVRITADDLIAVSMLSIPVPVGSRFAVGRRRCGLRIQLLPLTNPPERLRGLKANRSEHSKKG